MPVGRKGRGPASLGKKILNGTLAGFPGEGIPKTLKRERNLI